MTSEPMTVARPAALRAGRPRRTSKAPFWFLLPFCALFVMFFVAPLVYALRQSLFTEQRSGLFGQARTVFVGIQNYVTAARDQVFVSSIARMLLFGVVEIPTMIVFSLLLALLLDSASARFRKLFRGLFFLPHGVPGVVAALLWGFLYTPGLSPIVKVFGALGVHVDFFSPGATLWSIANVVIWVGAGYNMLVLTAQLQSIPGELYEAARTDGAGGWYIAWHIKIPMLRPALILTAVFGIIGTLQLFAEPQVLSSNDPNITRGYTPNLAAYSQAFDNNNYSYAAAESVIIALIALVVSFGFLKVTQRRESTS